jgi:hypothetical protein
MRRPIGLLPALLAAAVLTAAGCDEATTPTTPTTPTAPVIVTETFTGTINPNGAFTHSFPTEAAGTVSATLVTISPTSTIRVGLSLGTFNGVSCKIEIANDNAQQGVTVTGQASALGSFCVRIYDIGQLTENITYEVRVTHP